MASTKEPNFSTAAMDRKLNFLLVDDDSICQFIHRRVLELSGICASAQSALNGRDALDILNQATTGAVPVPDIILLDLQMPVMNGLEFLEVFREINSVYKERVAVALLSSSESPEDRKQAAALGVFHCISKPFTNEKLDALVSMLYGDITGVPSMVSRGADQCDNRGSN